MSAKISFLIPAHNEEKIIGAALERLAELKREYDDLEVIVGLDGCIDGTINEVKRYPFVKYVSFPERSGKQEVIRQLKKEASGNILVMNDADWHFDGNREDLIRLVECFDDPEVGGIGDYFTTSYQEDKVKSSKNLLFLGDAWTTLFALECKVKSCTKIINDKKYVDTGNLDFMFYVHFFRKQAVDEQVTLCDDGERMIQMVKKGFKVRLLETESRPYLKASYDHIGLKGFFKQRFRGFVADRQIKELYPWFKSGSTFSYVRILGYIICNLYRIRRIRSLAGLFLWWFIAIPAFIKFRLSNKTIDTVNGWKLRASRW